MRTAAYILNAIAALAALYDGKILVWEIAADDLRKGNGGWGTLVFSVIVSAAFLALPVLLGARWAHAGRAGAAMAVAMGSLVLSAVGFVILSSAFTP